MKLFFVAGEASGDARGVELMHSLRAENPAITFSGLGGPQMRALGGEGIENWTDRAGVIGIIDVVRNYGYFREKFYATAAVIDEMEPDAVVLIDYPGFNLRLAAEIKRRNPLQRVIYYISPQVWAWRRGRIPAMARTIDLMLCIFPFEKPLYENSGLKTEFVGHPMLDSLGAKRTNEPRDPNLVGLFPGSRKREVNKIFPVMLAAAARMKAQEPELRFEAAAASERMLALMQQTPGSTLVQIGLKNSHDLMQRAAAGMVASGTATMEAAFFRLPHVILYKAAWLTFFIGRRLVKVPWLGMANILAGREIVREFLQEKAEPGAISAEVLKLVKDPAARESLVAYTESVIQMLGEPGASERAAAAILQELA